MSMPAISAKDDTSALIPHLCAVIDQTGEALHIVCGFDNSVQMEYALSLIHIYYKIRRVNIFRSICSVAAKREFVNELLITNYYTR